MHDDIQRVSTGSLWEQRYGYCRALRAGNQIFLTGTAPIADDGSTFAPGDAHAQAERCIAIIEKALRV
jgi:enamine deaminase RidA (YjgF/YER057c/UK114 family)